MDAPILSQFDPSLMGAKDLENLLVHHKSLVDSVVNHLLQGTDSVGRRHIYLTGPWGMGKTHVVSVIRNRLMGSPGTSSPFRMAWIREGQWGVMSLFDLLVAILRALAATYDDATLAQQIDALLEAPKKRQEEAATSLLREYVGVSRLLLILEDADRVLGGLNSTDRRHLRALLDETPAFTVLATARTPLGNATKQANPLSPLFETHVLAEMGADETLTLLKRLTRQEDTLAFLDSPRGHALISAIHHMLGGVPRFHAALSHHLSPASMDQSLEPVQRTLDSVSPYFQTQLAGVSRQQSKLFEFICRQPHPVAVKEIARRNRMSHQSTSSQLKTLRDESYVRSIPVGRASYYEPQMPLVRYGVALAHRRTQEMDRLLTFLSAWYDRGESDPHDLPFPESNTALRKDFLLKPLIATQDTVDKPDLIPIAERFLTCAGNKDAGGALEYAEQIAKGGKRAWGTLAKVHCLLNLGQVDVTLGELDKLLKRKPKNGFAWGAKGIVLAHLRQYRSALDVFDKALALGAEGFNQIWTERATLLVALERHEEALESCDAALAKDDADPVAWYTRALALTRLNRLEEALESVESAIKRDGSMAEAWSLRGVILYQLDRKLGALESFDEALRRAPKDALAWLYRGAILRQQGQKEAATEAFAKAIQLGAQHPFVFLAQALSQLALGRWDGCIEAIGKTLARAGYAPGQLAQATGALLKHLFTEVDDVSVWRTRISGLLALYGKHQAGGALQVGLVNTVSAMVHGQRGQQAFLAWHDLWQELAGDQPAFALPLRLVDVAGRYTESQDLAILLELGRAERKIVTHLLGVNVKD